MSTMHWSIRVYQLLLLAYPRTFRRRFGADMASVFEDCLLDALAEQGKIGLFGLWVHTLLDWSTSATREHLLAIGVRSATQMDTTQFDSQLANNIKTMSNRLREGYSVRQCLEILSENAPEPSANEFKQLLDDLQNGTDAEVAFTDFSKRVQSDKLNTVVDVILEQRKEGGNLADKLDDIMESLTSS